MSSKFASPLLGYNNNVRHKGRVFHIQTEDSGAKYGHIITHLFMDGGRILKSVKTGYVEHVGSDRMVEIVRDLMKQQHKAMAVALRDGTFDRIIEGGSVSQGTLALSSGAMLAALPVELAGDPPSSVPASATVVSAQRASSDEYGSLAPSGPSSFAPTVSRPSEKFGDAFNGPEASEVAFDDRASASARGPSAEGPSSDQRSPSSPTPSSPNLRETSEKETYRVAAKPAPPSVGAATRAVATTRAASAFGQARPQGQSIFGEDLMSDKSLDEVILSYLAAELEGEKKR